MPLTLEEFERSPRSLPASGSLFRPRQSWFLPYVLASLLFGTLVFTGTVVSIHLTRLKEELREALSRGGQEDLAEQLAQRSGVLSDELLHSVGGTTALLLLGSALTVWWMGRRQRAGVEAIYQSLEGLTRGTSHPPRWVSTDEIGDLSSSVWLLFDRLQELPRELLAVTRRLGEASSRLGESSGLQQRTLERQSTALHETDTTAREIRENSLLARNRVQARRWRSWPSPPQLNGGAALEQQEQRLGPFSLGDERAPAWVLGHGTEAVQQGMILRAQLRVPTPMRSPIPHHGVSKAGRQTA